MFKCLNRSVVKKISKWSKPCEAVFEFLSLEDPKSLAKIIQEEPLEASDLTFAAEHMGNCEDTALVKKTLIPLLNHNEAVVREGAIYGLANHLDSVVKYKLFKISKIDKSTAVREAASNIVFRK
jgi:hypothetical protein